MIMHIFHRFQALQKNRGRPLSPSSKLCHCRAGLAATASLFCIKYKFHTEHSLHGGPAPKESNPEMQYLSTHPQHSRASLYESGHIQFEKNALFTSYTKRRAGSWTRDTRVQKAFTPLARDKKQQQELHSLPFHPRAPFILCSRAG